MYATCTCTGSLTSVTCTLWVQIFFIGYTVWKAADNIVNVHVHVHVLLTKP